MKSNGERGMEENVANDEYWCIEEWHERTGNRAVKAMLSCRKGES